MRTWIRPTRIGLILLGFAMAGVAQLAAAEESKVKKSGGADVFVEEDVGAVEAPQVVSREQLFNDGSHEGQPASECDEGCGCGGGACGLPGRVWVRGEYLHYWTKGARTPALVTTSTNLDNPIDNQETLFGDGVLNGRDHQGFRLLVGAWLDDCHTWGLEGEYFDLGRRSRNFDSGFSNGSPVLLRPYFDSSTTDAINPDTQEPYNPNFPGPIGQSAEAVAFPTGANPVAGRVEVQTSDYFQSSGMWLRRNLYCCDTVCGDGCDSPKWSFCGARSCRVDGIIGYRYARLRDSVSVHENIVNIGSDPDTVGTLFDVRDSFQAENEFHGIELGLNTSFVRGRWSLNLGGKVAFGGNHQIVDINGHTTSQLVGQDPTEAEGGLLAQTNSNIGNHNREKVAFLPEVNAEVGFQLTEHLRTYIGYEMIYWDKVVRAAEQIDPQVDSGSIPGAPYDATTDHPQFNYREASYWAQGVHAGAEFRY